MLPEGDLIATILGWGKEFGSQTEELLDDRSGFPDAQVDGPGNAAPRIGFPPELRHLI